MLMLKAAGAVTLAVFAAASANALEPIVWGETEVRYTTVCEKRWHALKIRDSRTLSADMGEGAEQQIQRETRLLFNGEAQCRTGEVGYAPASHPDIIEGAKTWVQIIDPAGPVACFGGKRCRWEIQTLHFVESHVTFDGVAYPQTAYVATPRPVQAARIKAPKAPKPNE